MPSEYIAYHYQAKKQQQIECHRRFVQEPSQFHHLTCRGRFPSSLTVMLDYRFLPINATNCDNFILPDYQTKQFRYSLAIAWPRPDVSLRNDTVYPQLEGGVMRYRSLGERPLSNPPPAANLGYAALRLWHYLFLWKVIRR